MTPAGTGLHGWYELATRPQSLATVRAGVGAVLLLAPQVLPRVLGVDAAARGRTSWLVQMVGVREVALAAGVLSARPGGSDPLDRAWAVAGSASDVVDACVIGAAVARGAVSRPWGSAVAASALAAGVAGLARSRRA